MTVGWMAVVETSTVVNTYICRTQKSQGTSCCQPGYMDPIEKNYNKKQNLQTSTAKPVIREMAHLVKCFVYDHEDPSSDSSTQMESKEVRASNPSTGKVETRESLELPNHPC